MGTILDFIVSCFQNTELTFNYHWDDLLGNEKKTCYCGAKKCAGQIGAKVKDLESIKVIFLLLNSSILHEK